MFGKRMGNISTNLPCSAEVQITSRRSPFAARRASLSGEVEKIGRILWSRSNGMPSAKTFLMQSRAPQTASRSYSDRRLLPPSLQQKRAQAQVARALLLAK